MARELQVRIIDDHRYEISQFNTTHSLRTLAKLTKLLGEPMILMISAFLKLQSGDNAKKKFGELDLKDLDTDILAKAARSLMERMDEEEVIILVKKLTSEGVLCDHQPVNFDLHYEGNFSHLFKVLVAALGVQYGNFTDAIIGQLPIARTVPSAGIKSV